MIIKTSKTILNVFINTLYSSFSRKLPYENLCKSGISPVWSDAAWIAGDILSSPAHNTDTFAAEYPSAFAADSVAVLGSGRVNSLLLDLKP
jgi:hypothetical protein